MNIHVSNFFISNNWEIWIFDLVDYSKWHKELDLAKICLWYNFNFSLSIKFLYLYWFDNINFKLLLTWLKDSYKNNNITKESAKNLYILLSYIKK